MLPTKKGRLFLGLTMSLALLVGAGCASKKYVKKQIDPVSGRVDELTEITKRNENAIKDVDGRAQTGIQSVQAKANEVDQKALAADDKAQKAQTMAQAAQSKISGVEANFNEKLGNIDNYKPIDSGVINFTFDRAELTSEAKAILDALAAKVKGTKAYLLEIQGFTDNLGSEDYNLALSQRRSETVVRYLAQQHQIPLYRMFILGLGEGREVEQNSTRAGRAANRRVEVTILKNDIDG